MKIKKLLKNKYFRLAIFAFTLYFTFVLRAHNYQTVPTANHLDELNYSLSGINLVETGMPISWSTLEYPKRAEVYKGEINYLGGIPKASVTLYRPWLDQPPLFSSIVGYSAHYFHADRNAFVPTSYSRIPSVLIAGLTSVMVFLIALEIGGFWIGILSMFIYGSVPMFVFASRSAMAENFIAFLFCLIFYLLLKFLQSSKTYLLYPIPILAGLAGLSKATGFFLLPFAALLVGAYYFQQKKYRSIFVSTAFFILGITPFIVAFFAYGYLYDVEIFNRILSIQSNRPAGFGSLAWFFISPSFSTNIFKDSWFVFCLFSAVFFMFTSKLTNTLSDLSNRKNLLVAAFIFSVFIVMISGGEGDLLAWYRFTSYPFLAIIGALGLQYLFQKADFFASFITAGMLLGNRMLLSNPFRDNVSPLEYRNIMFFLLLPSALYVVVKYNILKKLSKLFIVLTILAGIYINIIYVYNAFELTCENLTCPIVPSTKLSEMHFPFFWRFMVLGKPDRY